MIVATKRRKVTNSKRSAKVQPSSGTLLRRVATRNVVDWVQNLLWGRAAGRCEFAGCNKPLWKSSVTQEAVNTGQKAHIYAFSSGGPRGNKSVKRGQLNSHSNLLLVCHQCHRKIDKQNDGGRYTVQLLKTWKDQHERRVEIVTGIRPTRTSHVVFYGANIGDQASPLSFDDCASCLFPSRFPAEDRPVELGMKNSSWVDRDDQFWCVEEKQLRTQYAQRVAERRANASISHMSIFAIAPQPLLILLGTHLSDIPDVDVYQLHREPKGWQWPQTKRRSKYIIEEPKSLTGPPALVMSLSATIADDRIHASLGAAVTIWRMTVASPHNDLIKSRQQLADLRVALRPLMDRIKARHGQDAVLNIFPAMPISAAIELGRIRMPKADLAWRIYDQVAARGGFVRAIDILHGDRK